MSEDKPDRLLSDDEREMKNKIDNLVAALLSFGRSVAENHEHMRDLQARVQEQKKLFEDLIAHEQEILKRDQRP